MPRKKLPESIENGRRRRYSGKITALAGVYWDKSAGKAGIRRRRSKRIGRCDRSTQGSGHLKPSRWNGRLLPRKGTQPGKRSHVCYERKMGWSTNEKGQQALLYTHTANPEHMGRRLRAAVVTAPNSKNTDVTQSGRKSRRVDIVAARRQRHEVGVAGGVRGSAHIRTMRARNGCTLAFAKNQAVGQRERRKKRFDGNRRTRRQVSRLICSTIHRPSCT